MAHAQDPTKAYVVRGLPLILWRDLFVVVDEGHARADDYARVAQVVMEHASRHPLGLGCLTIIPASSKGPPPEDVRRAIKKALDGIAKFTRCTCWLVEGHGFRAATTRAALVGLRLFVRAPFPTQVTSDLREGLTWMLSRMEGKDRHRQVDEAIRAIERERVAMQLRGATPVAAAAAGRP